MTRITGITSVEVTFHDGHVKHFQSKSGDIITMDMQSTTTPPYYTLLIAPVAYSQKDAL